MRWLVYRQTEESEPDELLDSEFLDTRSKHEDIGSSTQSIFGNALHQSPADTVIGSSFSLGASCAGMNGRTNKLADTCYAWWGGASLYLLGQPTLYNQSAVRDYLLEKTQHPVLGGFGKFPGDLPDLYHSCLGLAALSLAGGEDVKEIDAGMCISKDAKARLKGLWQAWDL